jgi:hypothetical protein
MYRRERFENGTLNPTPDLPRWSNGATEWSLSWGDARSPRLGLGFALNLEILGRAEFTNGDRVFYMLPEQQRSAGHRATTSASAPAW